MQHRASLNARSRQGNTQTADPNNAAASNARPAVKRRDYLYRGYLHCGLCQRRMWGNARRRSSYYTCQPAHQRSASIPADHLPSVYLGEPAPHQALTQFLGHAVFGPDRAEYWRHCLQAAADHEDNPRPPHAERVAELEADTAISNAASTARSLTSKRTTPTPASGATSPPASPTSKAPSPNADATSRRCKTRSPPSHHNPTTSSPFSTSSHCSPTYPRAATPTLRQPPTPTHLPPQRQTIDVDITLADLTTNGEQTDETMSQVWLAPPAGIEPATVGLEVRCSVR